VVFLISGILYNVRPFRTKERAYLDVISESFNNPIRIMLGWSMVSESTIPPISLIFIFWFGGAFLMAIKRYSEYRLIVESKGSESLASYRRSFAKYSDVSLLVSSFFYAMLCAFALGVFLIKYRTEYVFAFPFFTALFSYYLYLGVKDAPSVQAPEKLYQEKGLMVILSLLIATLALLTLVDFPLLNKFILSSFTMLNFR